MLVRESTHPFTHGRLWLKLELTVPDGRDEQEFSLLVDDIFDRAVQGMLRVVPTLNSLPRSYVTQDEPASSTETLEVSLFGAKLGFKVVTETTYSVGDGIDSPINAIVIPKVTKDAIEHAITEIAVKTYNGLDIEPNFDDFESVLEGLSAVFLNRMGGRDREAPFEI